MLTKAEDSTESAGGMSTSGTFRIVRRQDATGSILLVETATAASRPIFPPRRPRTPAGVPAMHSQKVEAARAAIDSGNYTIDAERIADALLRGGQLSRH